jgi:hypothetical protein
MAKRLFQFTNYTPTATADSPTALANGTYQAIAGNAATQKIDVLEVMISGLAGASTPTIMQLARSGIIASTTTSLVTTSPSPASDGPMDPATAALAAPVRTWTSAVGGSQRSAANTDARLELAINAFGGIVRWNAAPTQQWNLVSSAAPGGESTLSAYTGGTVGAISSHIIYEPYLWLLSTLGATCGLLAHWSVLANLIA